MTSAPHVLGVFPFRRLTVWAKAHELTVRVYRVTDVPMARRFPALVSQLRRATASVPANIAEGSSYASQAQFHRFLEFALASAREADYHLLLARDLGALDSKEFAQLEARSGEVQGMLLGLRKRVAERARKGIGSQRVPRAAKQPSGAEQK